VGYTITSVVNSWSQSDLVSANDTTAAWNQRCSLDQKCETLRPTYSLPYCFAWARTTVSSSQRESANLKTPSPYHTQHKVESLRPLLEGRGFGPCSPRFIHRAVV
jgi:hypothetical protein